MPKSGARAKLVLAVPASLAGDVEMCGGDVDAGDVGEVFGEMWGDAGELGGGAAVAGQRGGDVIPVADAGGIEAGFGFLDAAGQEVLRRQHGPVRFFLAQRGPCAHDVVDQACLGGGVGLPFDDLAGHVDRQA